MAFWNRKRSEYEAMAALIEAQPGIRASELAAQLGVEKSTVLRRMPSLEDAGILLAEDEHRNALRELFDCPRCGNRLVPVTVIESMQIGVGEGRDQ